MIIKHLPFAFLLMCLSINIKAQDLGITQVSLKDYTEVKANTTKAIGVIIQVHDSILKASTIDISYRIDQGSIVPALSNIPVNPLPTGQQLSPQFCPIRFPNRLNDTIQITLILDYKDDVNAQNDSFQLLLILKDQVPNDIVVHFKTNNNDSLIEIGKPYQIFPSVKNIGTTTWRGNQIFSQRLNVNGQLMGSPQIIPNTGADLKPGDSMQLPPVTIQFDMADLNQTFEFCYIAVWAELTDSSLNFIEGNFNDNMECISIKAIISGINKPAIDPLINSIHLNENSLEIAFSQQLDLNQYVSVMITDLTGKTLLNHSEFAQNQLHNIMVPFLQPGCYIITVEAENGISESRKIMMH